MGTGDCVVSEYRRRAEECRLQAKKAKSEDDKARWLQLAERWEYIAADAKRRLRVDPPEPVSKPFHRRVARSFARASRYTRKLMPATAVKQFCRRGRRRRSVCSRAADRGRRSMTTRMDGTVPRSRLNNVAMSRFELLRVRPASRRDHVQSCAGNRRKAGEPSTPGQKSAMPSPRERIFNGDQPCFLRPVTDEQAVRVPQAGARAKWAPPIGSR